MDSKSVELWFMSVRVGLMNKTLIKLYYQDLVNKKLTRIINKTLIKL